MKKSEIKELIREVLQEELEPIKEAFAILLTESLQSNNPKKKQIKESTKASLRQVTGKNIMKRKRENLSPIESVLEQTQMEIESGHSAPIINESNMKQMLTSGDAMGFGMQRKFGETGITLNPSSVDDIRLQNKLASAIESGDENVIENINRVNDIINRDYSQVLKDSIAATNRRRGK